MESWNLQNLEARCGREPLRLTEARSGAQVCDPQPTGRRRGNEAHFFVVIVLALATIVLRADALANDFEQANKLYEKGKYAEAAGAYEKLTQQGNNATALHFNLGNAQFKAGQIGRAIASYQRAERLAPRDPEVRANLQFARNTASGGTGFSHNRWRDWIKSLTLNEWSALFSAANWAWFALLIAGQFRAEFKQSLRGYTATMGLAAAFLAVCLGSAVHEQFYLKPAIVIKQEAVVRYGPLEESKSSFTLRDGAELTILERKDDWLQVRDASRRVGWLRRENVILLTPEKG